jgi:AraC-like DNA-binding protein
METQEMETALRSVCNSQALCQMNALVRDLTGLGLLVIWSRGSEVFGQIPVCDNERELPQFCRILHEIPQGLQRCITCHSLAAATLSEAFHGRLRIETDDRNIPSRQAGIESKLREALKQVHKPGFRNVSGSVQTTLVDVVQSVVGANPHLPVTVADVARAAQITPNHFSLIFRRQTGTTFSEFLAEKRFERSVERLQDLTLSIAQVARQSGFSEPNYFAKIFRKRTGMAPREWRLRNQKKTQQEKKAAPANKRHGRPEKAPA